MRKITKPSTAQCNIDLYTLFLLSEPKLGGCSRLSEILGDVSHDSINRFLLKERYEPKDLFSEIEKIINWGVKPKIVTGDSWYSGVENLKFIKNQKLGFLFGIEKNRTVSNEPHNYCQVSTLEIPESGLITHLKEFGFIKLFRKSFKKEASRNYIFYFP